MICIRTYSSVATRVRGTTAHDRSFHCCMGRHCSDHRSLPRLPLLPPPSWGTSSEPRRHFAHVAARTDAISAAAVTSGGRRRIIGVAFSKEDRKEDMTSPLTRSAAARSAAVSTKERPPSFAFP